MYQSQKIVKQRMVLSFSCVDFADAETNIYDLTEVIMESNNLERVTQEITSGMNEMASGADQINIAVNHVNEISNKNREDIALLLKEVSRFKVE